MLGEPNNKAKYTHAYDNGASADTYLRMLSVTSAKRKGTSQVPAERDRLQRPTEGVSANDSRTAVLERRGQDGSQPATVNRDLETMTSCNYLPFVNGLRDPSTPM